VVCSDRLNRDMVQEERCLFHSVGVWLAEDILNRLVNCSRVLVSCLQSVGVGRHTAMDRVGILVRDLDAELLLQQDSLAAVHSSSHLRHRHLAL